MKVTATLLLLFSLLPIALVQAQEAGKKSIVGPQPVNSSTGTYIPMPPELQAKEKILQHKFDMLELDNLHMQVKIAQNQQLQLELQYEMQGAAFDFATQKHIDLGLYMLDMNDEPKFVPKKKAQ